MLNFRTILTVGLVVALCGHVFLYFTAVRFFSITRRAYRLGIAGLLAFLFASAPLSGYVAHLADNAPTRVYYVFGWAWMGLFLYLLMAAVAGWLALGVGRLAGRRADAALIGGILFCAAFFYSAHGVWNAFHPVVKNVDVTIKGLPDRWKGRTIVQLSDVHLGHVYRAGFMRKVVDKVNAIHPDMIVITGDLFDGMDGTLPELVEPLKDLKAPEGVYFITGNHENFLGADKAYSMMKDTGVTVLNDEVRDVDGLQLAGVSYPERGKVRDKVPGRLLRTLPGFAPGKPTVLLYHAPVYIKEAMEAGVGLQLSGHTHEGQLFPFGFVTRRVYKGYDYGLHTIGDCSVYTSCGVGSWGPPMRTGNTPEIVDIRLD